MLLENFAKQDAIRQAEVLGMSIKTMEKWIVKLMQSTDIVCVTHGRYQNRDYKNCISENWVFRVNRVNEKYPKYPKYPTLFVTEIPDRTE